MRSRQLVLDLNGDGDDDPIAIVFLACRLTGLTSDGLPAPKATRFA
jgi:hypothetical protein